MSDTKQYNNPPPPPQKKKKKYHYYLWVYWKSAFRGHALTDSEVT